MFFWKSPVQFLIQTEQTEIVYQEEQESTKFADLSSLKPSV